METNETLEEVQAELADINTWLVILASSLDSETNQPTPQTQKAALFALSNRLHRVMDRLAGSH